MKYKDEYIDLSEQCDYCLNNCVLESHVESVLGESNLDYSNVLYKRTIDDIETVNVDDKDVTLLPLGLINNRVRNFLSINVKDVSQRRALRDFKKLLISKDDFTVLCYPDDLKLPTKEQLASVCASYIDYYKKALDETWSIDTFYEMFSELKYLTVKYARIGEDGEPFVIGFFGAYERSGATGKCLTNAELYVMPEFRKLGIAKNMVGLTFLQARSNGIDSFDSITYRVEDQNALAFWQKVGAEVSGLIHIEGDISEMINVIGNSNNMKK